MSKLNIYNLRYGIAHRIKEKFSISDGNELTNSIFIVHNVFKYPCKIVPIKCYHQNRKPKILIKKEKGMNRDNLKKIELIWEKKNTFYHVDVYTKPSLKRIHE